MCKQEKETLTVRDIQEIMQIGVNAAYSLIHSKSFPVIRLGRSYRIPRDGFYAWLNESRAVDL